MSHESISNRNRAGRKVYRYIKYEGDLFILQARVDKEKSWNDCSCFAELSFADEINYVHKFSTNPAMFTEFLQISVTNPSFECKWPRSQTGIMRYTSNFVKTAFLTHKTKFKQSSVSVFVVV